VLAVDGLEERRQEQADGASADHVDSTDGTRRPPRRHGAIVAATDFRSPPEALHRTPRFEMEVQQVAFRAYPVHQMVRAGC
jgi:hypothetical protein